MELFLLRIFQLQVADQCRVVITSAAQINSSVAARDSDQLWVACQAFVVGAGNLSKALWGSGGKLHEERRPLRESLSVTDDSPLQKVDMRNNFEHYDERIDRWYRESSSRNHLDRMIGPRNMVAGLADIDRFRVFDTSTNSILFWGDSFDLQPIATEVARIFPIAEREARKPHWVQ
jgi:hypothetical protein